jgi:hypothetical protein
MVRLSRTVILVVGMLAPWGLQAAQDGDDPGQTQGQPTPIPDAMINRQILETLSDIRDSQLATLKVEAEILSILRSQATLPTAAHEHVAAPPVPGHRKTERVSKGHRGGAKGRELVAVRSLGL